MLGLMHYRHFKMELFNVDMELLSNILVEKQYGQNKIRD